MPVLSSHLPQKCLQPSLDVTSDESDEVLLSGESVAKLLDLLRMLFHWIGQRSCSQNGRVRGTSFSKVSTYHAPRHRQMSEGGGQDAGVGR